MNSVKKIKAAVIGCGMISNIYIRNLKNMFYIIDLAAVCDRNESAAKAQSDRFGIDRVMTSEEIAASDDIELVINLTGPAVHYSVIREMLLAGKHVYTEKMFTTDLAQAKELVDLANEKGLYLGVAPDTVLGAGIQTARKILDAGLIGEVTSVQAHINRNQPLNSETFRFLRGEGGSLPYDVGIYYIAAMTALLGPIHSIRAFGNPAPDHQAQLLYDADPGDHWQLPGNNVLSAIFRFENDIIGNVHFDGNTVNDSQHGFTIYGTKGILKLGDPNSFDGEVSLILPDSGETRIPFTHGYNGKSIFPEPQWFDVYGNRGIGVAEMAWAIRTGRSDFRCSKEYGLHCMEVLIGMDEAANTGETYMPESRFYMKPLASGFNAIDSMGKCDPERSLII